MQNITPKAKIAGHFFMAEKLETETKKLNSKETSERLVTCTVNDNSDKNEDRRANSSCCSKPSKPIDYIKCYLCEEQIIFTNIKVHLLDCKEAWDTTQSKVLFDNLKLKPAEPSWFKR